MTNAASGNHVLVFANGPGGPVRQVASVATGGLGTGANLASEGSIATSPDLPDRDRPEPSIAAARVGRRRWQAGNVDEWSLRVFGWEPTRTQD
jgi:hypothetical protein